MVTQTQYIPGMCNINHEEIKTRRKAGHTGLIMFVGLLVILAVIDVTVFARLVLFIPAFIAAIGYLQARNKFCVGYASAGQHNADDGSSTAASVTDTQNVRADKKRARTINIQAVLIAAAVTALALLIP